MRPEELSLDISRARVSCPAFVMKGRKRPGSFLTVANEIRCSSGCDLAPIRNSRMN